MKFKLPQFVLESNRIEGINGVTDDEIIAHEKILELPKITIPDLQEFVHTVQPFAELRNKKGLDVRAGNHIPVRGGPVVEGQLSTLLDKMNGSKEISGLAARIAWSTHADYETIHPFTDGNGRSGRVLWLWMMGGKTPYGFLRHWYYQSLSHYRK